MVETGLLSAIVEEISAGEMLTAVVGLLGILATIVVGRAQRLRDVPRLHFSVGFGSQHPSSSYDPSTDTFVGPPAPTITLRVQNQGRIGVELKALVLSGVLGHVATLPLYSRFATAQVPAESVREFYAYLPTSEPLFRLAKPRTQLFRASLIDAGESACARRWLRLSLPVSTDVRAG